MAAARKLQAEIDRTLKKVQEGIEVFDEIWEKVHDTENANQKEKFEADLKTAIKKLQRHRDQIKTWISSADIKDKTVLVEARKSIEREMERFKVCEKEAKTKAFSKAGLGLADKLDPKEEAKSEAKDWVNNVVSTLQVQVEELEYELEELQANVKKKQKPPPRAARIEESLGRHKEHMTRLEQVLRCLDNETISPEEIADLREDVDTYLGGAGGDEEELDYEHVDDMYAVILDKLEAVDSHIPVSAAVPKHPRTKADKKKADSLDDDDASALASKDRDKDKDREKERAIAAAAKLQLGKGRNNVSVKFADEDESEASTKPSLSIPSSALSPVPALRPSASLKESADASPATTPSSASTPTPALQRPPLQRGLDSKSAALNSEDTATSSTSSASATANGNTPTAANPPDNPPTANGQTSHAAAALPAWIPTRPDLAPGNSTTAKSSNSTSTSKPALVAPTTTATTTTSTNPAGPAASSGSAVANSTADTPAPSEPSEASTSKPSDLSPGLLKLPVLDPTRTGKSLEFQLGQMLPTVNPQLSLQIIDNVHSKSMPHSNDADWNSKRFRPRYPVNTPASYPRVAPDVVDNPALFRKMDPEALFFAFYYQPDTYQQYLAAQELKRQSWRYHKVHNAWFQRYAEPTLTTEEYEQGTYVYFDYNIMHDDHQTGWCYRRKENFTFRYDALEDELQVLPA